MKRLKKTCAKVVIKRATNKINPDAPSVRLCQRHQVPTLPAAWSKRTARRANQSTYPALASFSPTQYNLLPLYMSTIVVALDCFFVAVFFIFCYHYSYPSPTHDIVIYNHTSQPNRRRTTRTAGEPASCWRPCERYDGGRRGPGQRILSALGDGAAAGARELPRLSYRAAVTTVPVGFAVVVHNSTIVILLPR